MMCRFKIGYNVLQLPEGGDFGALHCKPSRNFDRSTKFDLTTEPPLLGRCCYRALFLFVVSLVAQNFIYKVNPVVFRNCLVNVVVGLNTFVVNGKVRYAFAS